ncbi:MAG: hypothetical protein AB7E47_05955 [Desulfovibrionaceae bacterium]
MIAYCWRNGVIEFDYVCPDDALRLAEGPEGALRRAVCPVARWAYDNRTPLVPGVPEAKDEDEAFAAAVAFGKTVRRDMGSILATGKHYLAGPSDSCCVTIYGGEADVDQLLDVFQRESGQRSLDLLVERAATYAASGERFAPGVGPIELDGSLPDGVDGYLWSGVAVERLDAEA